MNELKLLSVDQVILPYVMCYFVFFSNLKNVDIINNVKDPLHKNKEVKKKHYV